VRGDPALTLFLYVPGKSIVTSNSCLALSSFDAKLLFAGNVITVHVIYMIIVMKKESDACAEIFQSLL